MLDKRIMNNACSTNKPVTVIASGTCGELVQGAIGGSDFLVNCPIDRFSSAILRNNGDAGLVVEKPDEYRKVQKVADVIGEMFGLNFCHSLEIISEIPTGKGMASSSADIIAAAVAIKYAFGIKVNHQLLAQIATQIEPSDCVHFPDISQVNHLSGKLIASMPAPVGLRTLIVDCGGEVDSINFDREFARHLYREQPLVIQEALSALKIGLRSKNNKLIAKAATLSATLNQHVLYKPQFEELSLLTSKLGALGVNCAHSGTVLGVLYEPSSVDKDTLVEHIIRHFSNDLTVVGDHTIIGGCYYGY